MKISLETGKPFFLLKRLAEITFESLLFDNYL